MLIQTDDALVGLILQVAARDASIARVLRDICALEPRVRRSALGLVGVHAAGRRVAPDFAECLGALGRDEVARRIAEALAPR
ncbi:MAG: hypothetical protein HY294_03890 [Candidatus Rokubacteria bacterium]|nr:hypothetical protein [Candidatus Rokubacteria bacterium]MBI3825117.1 hypothetical protein [Candidatus Rokubacteria bacterium]